ncbi:MAG: FtsH protease activity modulator HflK [Zetaproteobacteria bacterium]|nr:FtsH protease activity modulator HflK [Pseudobdellovibrionaceae bacterium]
MNQGPDEFDDLKQKVRQLFNADGRPNRGGPGGSDGGKQPSQVFAGVVVAVVVLLMFNSFYTVDTEEEAVVTRFGAFHTTTQPGAHFKLPIVDKIYKVKSKRRKVEEFGFRDEGRRTRRDLSDESLMLTGDLNLADVLWVVQYEISDPWKYLFKAADGGTYRDPTLSGVQKTIREVSMSVMRRVVGDRMVGRVLTTGRTEIAIKARELMQETLERYDLGIRITTVELQSVTPPNVVRPAFNDVNAAKQEQEQAINRAEREYNSIIPEARGKAEQMIADAEAYAVDVVNRAKGDASHFKSILSEYKKAPKATRKRIYIETMEQVLSNIDEYTIVDSQAKGLLPVYGKLSPAVESAVAPKVK